MNTTSSLNIAYKETAFQVENRELLTYEDRSTLGERHSNLERVYKACHSWFETFNKSREETQNNDLVSSSAY